LPTRDAGPPSPALTLSCPPAGPTTANESPTFSPRPEGRDPELVEGCPAPSRRTATGSCVPAMVRDGAGCAHRVIATTDSD
jgi:hypothetical protein